MNQSFIAKKSPKEVLEENEVEFNPFCDSVIDALNHDLRPNSTY